MILNTFGKVEEMLENFKEFVTRDGNSYIILIIFGALILLFLFGFNAIHRNDK